MTIQANFPNVLPSLLLDFANAKKLDPRVTFTRATTAVYYDADTTAMAEQNLVTYSQQFNAWINGNVTLTGSQTAPDGTSTAWLMTDLGNNDDHRIYAFPSASTNTYSIGSAYFKNGTRRYAMLRLQDSSIIAGAVFDLQTGTVASTGGPNYYSSSITSVGGGWYRCVVIGTGFTNGVGNFVLAMSDTATYSANIIYAGSGATLYAWGAQVETRPTPNATAYTPTTTQVITTYIPVLMTAGGGQPRFDHNPTTRESLGLLIEEQRTNVLQKSGPLTSGSGTGNWNQYYGATFTNNATIAPDGTLTASSMYPMVGGGTTGLSAYYSDGVSLTSGTTYTFSVYLKAGGISAITLSFTGTGSGGGLSLNLTTGTIVSGAGTITSVGNGWYRCSISVTPVSTGSFYPAINYTSQQSGGANNQFLNVFAWGAQVETGAFPTSYIPTTNAAATRAADAASMTGGNFAAWYSAGQGTFYSEANTNATDFTGVVFASGSGYNAIGTYNGNTSTSAGMEVGYVGSQVVNISLTVSAKPAFSRIAIAYAENDFAAVANGGTVGTDTSGNIPTVDSLKIGRLYSDLLPLNGTIKKIAYYPVRVTNAQLQALTS
jgi:hypothetical protein